jgi:type III pantothenate kinase
MKLCFDVGNSTICGAFFDGGQLSKHFLLETEGRDFLWTPELFAQKFDEVFTRCDADKNSIDETLVSSVVARVDDALKEACESRLRSKVFFLNADNVGTLKIKTESAQKTGADLIAADIAAANKFPEKNAVIVDFGTVTTVTALDKEKTFLGGAFIPGMGIQSKSLGFASDNLFRTEIKRPEKVTGTSTESALESGIFYGTYGAVKHIVEKMIEENFPSDDGALVIGTGGYGRLFEGQSLFDFAYPDMVLEGLLYWRGDL